MNKKFLVVGNEILFKGIVLGHVSGKGFMDGPATLKILTYTGNIVEIEYGKFRGCFNGTGNVAKLGDKVEIYGQVSGRNHITLCLTKSLNVDRQESFIRLNTNKPSYTIYY